MKSNESKKTLYVRSVEQTVETGLRVWATELNLSVAGLLKAILAMKNQIKLGGKS